MKEPSKKDETKSPTTQEKKGKLLPDKEQKELKEDLLKTGEATEKPQFHNLPEDDTDKPKPVMLKK